MNPSIGRIVHYILDDVDVEILTQGSHTAGTHTAAIVTAAAGPIANLSVFLGSTCLGLEGIVEGNMPGTWHWPERE